MEDIDLKLKERLRKFKEIDDNVVINQNSNNKQQREEDLNINCSDYKNLHDLSQFSYVNENEYNLPLQKKSASNSNTTLNIVPSKQNSYDSERFLTKDLYDYQTYRDNYEKINNNNNSKRNYDVSKFKNNNANYLSNNNKTKENLNVDLRNKSNVSNSNQNNGLNNNRNLIKDSSKSKISGKSCENDYNSNFNYNSKKNDTNQLNQQIISKNNRSRSKLRESKSNSSISRSYSKSPSKVINSKQTASNYFSNCGSKYSNCNINGGNNAFGERLYNNANFYREKIERKRIELDYNMRKNMTPEITNKAKNINRDPNKFGERLYPGIKNKSVNTSNNLEINSSNISTNKEEVMTDNFQTDDSQIERIYRKKNDVESKMIKFEHKPHLDKKSLQIAERLGSAKERLYANKRKSRSKSFDKKADYNYLNTSKTSKSPTNKETENSHIFNPEKINELYQRGLKSKKAREEQYNNKLVLEQNQYKNFPYKPKISELNHSKSPESSRKVDLSNKKDFYNKAVHWKKNIEIKTDKERETYEKNQKALYTFKPNIIKKEIQNDEEFIKKNLEQIEDYVSKRRSVLKKKEEDEEYKRKKFNYGENYNMKPTIVKEFSFECNKRAERVKSLSPGRQVLNENNNNLQIIRNKLKTEDFFKENEKHNLKTIRNEQKIKKHVQNLSTNNNNNNYNNTNSNEDHAAFLKAVSNLHENLVNFKI